jgi:hypothetical protein
MREMIMPSKIGRKSYTQEKKEKVTMKRRVAHKKTHTNHAVDKRRSDARQRSQKWEHHSTLSFRASFRVHSARVPSVRARVRVQIVRVSS